MASQDNSGTHIEASTTLTVPCQTLTVDPTCEAAADGQAGAYAITATGLGFDQGVVDLVFDPTGFAPAATQVQADATGAFTAPLTLTGKPAGVYDLWPARSRLMACLRRRVPSLWCPVALSSCA